MTVLITGGTGKTGTVLAQRLHAANIDVLIASRSGKAPEPFRAVVLDWNNAATLQNPFKADSAINSVYLVIQRGSEALANVKAFNDLARSKGVKRFVLLSASQVEAGGKATGEIHQYLIDVRVDYTVLRPTWFHENFGQTMVSRIRDKDETLSATGNGRIAFVSTADIADATLEALTAEPSLNREVWVFGPELLSYDEVAKIFSAVLGREITHVKSTVQEMTDHYATFGLPHAAALAAQEGAVANHAEERLFNSTTGSKYIGKRTLEQYIRENRTLWEK